MPGVHLSIFGIPPLSHNCGAETRAAKGANSEGTPGCGSRQEADVSRVSTHLSTLLILRITSAGAGRFTWQRLCQFESSSPSRNRHKEPTVSRDTSSDSRQRLARRLRNRVWHKKCPLSRKVPPHHIVGGVFRIVRIHQPQKPITPRARIQAEPTPSLTIALPQPPADRNQMRQVVTEWNASPTRSTRDKAIHELFEEQAAATPDVAALFFEDRELSYAELNGRTPWPTTSSAWESREET
jgi:hypothetical protein